MKTPSKKLKKLMLELKMEVEGLAFLLQIPVEKMKVIISEQFRVRLSKNEALALFHFSDIPVDEWKHDRSYCE